MKYHIFKINIKFLNIVSNIFLIILCLLTWMIFPNMVNEIMVWFSNTNNVILFLPLYLGYVILHELLHALGYIIYGADPKKITFGMELEKGVFYCLCKAEVTRKNILYSLMYPLFFIGIVTYIVGIIFNYPLLVLLSLLNIAGAIGDIVYFIFISRLDKSIMFSEMDDGTSFAIISKDNPDKVKHIGLIYDGVRDEIPRNDFKRLKVSKLSMVVLIICVIAIICGLFM